MFLHVDLPYGSSNLDRSHATVMGGSRGQVECITYSISECSGLAHFFTCLESWCVKLQAKLTMRYAKVYLVSRVPLSGQHLNTRTLCNCDLMQNVLLKLGLGSFVTLRVGIKVRQCDFSY